MKGKVTIKAHPVTGEVVTPYENNPEYGAFRVEQTFTGFSNGILNMNKRVAFSTIRMSDAQQLINSGVLVNGATMPGNIQINETSSPAYAGHKPKIYPSDSPKAGQNVLSGGNPVYRDTTVIAAGLDVNDTLLLTDNENTVITEVHDEQKELAE